MLFNMEHAQALLHLTF